MDKKEKTPWPLFHWLEERPWLRFALAALLIALATVLQWLQLELSSHASLDEILSRRWAYPAIALCMVLLVDMLLLLLTRRWWLAYLLGSLFFCVWAVANHYVLWYSGNVLTISSLRSAGTALDVLDRYHLSIDTQTAHALWLLAADLCAVLAMRLLLPRPIPWRRIWAAAGTAVLLAGGIGWAVPYMETIDPPQLWTHRFDLAAYGYPVYFVQHALRTMHPIQRPDGYSARALDALVPDSDSQAEPQSRPDIIFILNESYYFLDDYTDMDVDASYNAYWSSMPNALRGRVVVPSIGGATNQSEYEMLTSNSMRLLNAWAPFSVLDLSDANSVVRYLSSLGYTTDAMHDAIPTNYNRNLAYPAMGFDQARFHGVFVPDFFGNRYETDRALYQDMFTFYLTFNEDPHFIFLLTCQNHGGYQNNDPETDTVHTGRDFGDLTDDVDEYLSCIRLSDEALRRLTSYFDRVDRPVLICMVGDHAPSFINQLSPRDGMTEQEQEIVARSTPFFIWANKAFGSIGTGDLGTVSMPDVAPMMLSIAGLPLSPYYQTILDLSSEIPVRLSTGLYRTAAGEYGQFAPDDERYEQLCPYYFMEYNNLQSGSERRQVLFEP